LRGTARHRLGRALRQQPLASLTLVTAALMSATLLASLTLTWLAAADHEQFAQLVGTAWVGTAALSAAAVVFAFIREARGAPRNLWLLAISLTAWATGAAVWFLTLQQHGSTVMTGRGDAIYLAAAALTAAAVLTHPDLQGKRLRIAIDGSIGALSMVVLYWMLAGRELAERSGDPVGSLVTVAYAASAIVVVRAGLVVTLQRRPGSVAAATAAIGTGGFLALQVGNSLLLTHRAFDGGAATALAADAVVVLGLTLIGVAVLHLRASRPVQIVSPHRSIGRLLSTSHLTVALLAVAGVLADAALRGSFDATASVVMTVVICSVLLRQSLTLADNRSLSASLRATVDDLAAQATHDALTGLPNRAGLEGRISAAAQRADTSGTTSALFFVDLDHLKAVNDSLGHRAGDVMIRATAERLSARVGSGVTRFGGDEFVVVVEGLASPSAADELGRTMVTDTGRPVALEGHQVSASASVGVAMIDAATRPEEVLRRADVALYRAKGMGRNCMAGYREQDDSGLHDDLDLEGELRRAVQRDELTLHYQPIIDLHSGMVVSVESLLRWQHPTRGLLFPGSFLEQAISAGLLGSIGAASLRLACRDFTSVPPGHSVPQPPSVAVNLSSSELTDRRVVERVTTALTESGLPPGRLTLEITEDVIVDDAMRATIDSLRALGVHLAIDDFGTGNSSLRQLGSYPADVLKIDRSFVERLEDDPRAVAITTAIVRLARNLGLVTVAEGVETEGQARVLARIGCDRAQGWLYARAMPFDELVTWCGDNCPVERYRDSRDSVASASSMMRASSSATGGRSSIAPTT
jgi:diguanylate cyclase (GGDEF)-like protein